MKIKLFIALLSLCVVLPSTCFAQSFQRLEVGPVHPTSLYRVQEESLRAEVGQFYAYNGNSQAVVLHSMTLQNGLRAGLGYDYAQCSVALRELNLFPELNPPRTANTGRTVISSWGLVAGSDVSELTFRDAVYPKAGGLVVPPHAIFGLQLTCPTPAFQPAIKEQAIQLTITSWSYQLYEGQHVGWLQGQILPGNPTSVTADICSKTEQEVLFVGPTAPLTFVLGARDTGTLVYAFRAHHLRADHGSYYFLFLLPNFFYADDVGLQYLFTNPQPDPLDISLADFDLTVRDSGLLPPAGSYEGTIKMGGYPSDPDFRPCLQHIPVTVVIP